MKKTVYRLGLCIQSVLAYTYKEAQDTLTGLKETVPTRVLAIWRGVLVG